MFYRHLCVLIIYTVFRSLFFEILELLMLCTHLCVLIIYAVFYSIENEILKSSMSMHVNALCCKTSFSILFDAQRLEVNNEVIEIFHLICHNVGWNICHHPQQQLGPGILNAGRVAKQEKQQNSL